MGEGIYTYGLSGKSRNGNGAIRAQSFVSAARRYYTANMRPLLNVKIKKQMGNTTRNVGFSSRGNKHLFSDVVIHRSNSLQMGDLIKMPTYLRDSDYVKSASISKPRPNDRITKFHYFKVRMHGNNVFLNVAEETNKRGKVTNTYLYSVTDKIKAT